MPKEIPIHKDIIGRSLTVGDHVAFSHDNRLLLGRIMKFNPKMIKLEFTAWHDTSTCTINKYPSDSVKLEGPDLVMYLLKK